MMRIKLSDEPAEVGVSYRTKRKTESRNQELLS